MKSSWYAALAVVVSVASVGCSGSGGTRTVPTSPGSSALSAPTLQGPINDAQLDTFRPVLTVTNATSSESGARTYEFQISDRADFLTTVVSQAGIAEGGGTTTFTPGADLPASAQLHWRARAQQGTIVSAWSGTGLFRTKLGGYNRAGALFDPLTNGQTIGTRSGSTTFQGAQGLRVDNNTSWVRYQLAQTLTSGEISVEVSGLAPNHPGEKSRIFSMSDATPRLFDSPYLFNVQYRGLNGNPNNAISFKLLNGGEAFKFEPDITQRTAGIRALNPATVYLWTATWGSTFRLTVREGGATGPVIYDLSMPTSGTYNPVPHIVYLGATDANIESGSWPGAIYRNLWVGSGPRPSTLSSVRK
ncbi:MAG: hypothetical protein M3R55_00135 [Acidobacteriota bacterium]|nr:hypothetical protein [Acidobacteriota bacterium]